MQVCYKFISQYFAHALSVDTQIHPEAIFILRL